MYSWMQHKAVEIGRLAVRSTTLAGSGHPSSALALSHIVTALMYHQMRFDPKDPWNPGNDRLVLSEGHAVPVVYAAYCDQGGVYGMSKDQAKELTVEDLDDLRNIDSALDGHPNPGVGFPFFDAATGSLGQGLSVAAGLGLAARNDGIDKRIYCVIGDGESREGQVWEAVDFLVDNKLTNVTPIFNSNGQGQSDYVSPQQRADTLAKKLGAYGCKPVVIDGHDLMEIENALNTREEGKVVAIVANTQKGWGVEKLKAHTNHGKPLDEEGMKAAMCDLDTIEAALPPAPADECCAPGKPEKVERQCSEKIKPLPKPDFSTMIPDEKLAKKFAGSGKLATRHAYGIALLELGRLNPCVAALDGDVSNSTFSLWFAKEFPDRYFECRIAEQNMLSTAVGLAAAGKIPFVSSFGKFLARAYDQIDLATIGGAKIKITGSHSGASLGADGPSQMSLSDVAYFRSMTGVEAQFGGPLCTVFIPGDAYAAYKLVGLCAEIDGMTYMRTGRPEVELLYDADTEFEVGGAFQLAEGDDVTLISNGYMLHEVKALLPDLEKEGIKAGLVDAYSFPIRAQLLKGLTADKGRTLVTVEDNYLGGLHGAIAELAAAQGGARVIGSTLKRVPKSGKSAGDVFAYSGVGKADVIATVKKALGK